MGYPPMKSSLTEDELVDPPVPAVWEGAMRCDICGHIEVHANHAAALVRTPVADTAGIDAARLRAALVAADEVMGNRYSETFPLDLTPAGWPRFAEAIAAEYDRLSAAALRTPKPEGER